MFKVYKEDKICSIQSEKTECKLEFIESFAAKTAAVDFLKEKFSQESQNYSYKKICLGEEEFSYEYEESNISIVESLHHIIRFYIEECNVVKNGEELVDVSGLDYDYIDDFYFERAIVRRNGEWGIIDSNFEPILYCDKYKHIKSYKEHSFTDYEPIAEISIQKGRFVFQGTIDLSGNFVVVANGGIHRVPSKDIFWAFTKSETKWVKVQIYSDTVEPFSYPYTEYEEYSFYDVERRVFMKFGELPTIGDPFGVEGYALAIGGFEGDVARFSYEGKVGVIDSEENIVVEPKYKQISQFSDGLAAVETFALTKYEFMPGGKLYRHVTTKKCKWGFINKLGVEVIPPQYDMVYPFSAGLAPFNIGGEVEAIQTVDVPEELDTSFTYEDTHVLSFKGGKWGFINVKGEIVIPPEYDACSRFFDGRVAIIGKNKKLGLITADLKYQTELLYKSIRYDTDSRFLRPSFIAETEGYDEDGDRFVKEWSIFDGPEGFIVKERSIDYPDYN